jgi:acyl-CoA synthetase (AMP-forming)/AMP-acid ligase II
VSASANVALLFAEEARQRPAQLALAVGHRNGFEECTYAELDARAEAYARGFSALGFRRGDRTLFLVRPSVKFYAMVLGLLKIGAIPVVVDPGMGIGNVLKCIAQIRPRTMVALSLVHAIRRFAPSSFSTVEVAVTVGRRWFWGGHTEAEAFQPSAEAFPIQTFTASDEAFIVFTSGSTGTPKGVSFRHGMFAGATQILATHAGLGAGRCSMETFAPFVPFHLALGETVVVPFMNLSKPATADPRHIAAAIAKYRPQTAFASPVVLRKLLEYCRETGTKLDSIDTLLTGVAPVPGELHRGFREVLRSDAQVSVNYGATEALTVSSIRTDEVLGETWEATTRGAGYCVGRPYPELDVRIIRVSDDPIRAWNPSLELPVGEIGEVIVRGAVASPEYKDAPAANEASKIKAGESFFHRMGDLGYFDERGRLWFCGRKAHRIETSEGMLPNLAVEGIFAEHVGVRRVALIAGPGPRGQQTPVLWFEEESGLRADPPLPTGQQLEREVLALADGTRWAGRVKHAVRYPGKFPMDARHNSKIRYEEIMAFSQKRQNLLPSNVAGGGAR